MYAILGLAALHLSHLSPATSKPATALAYHDHCIKLMVPMLSDTTKVHDDILLLTSIILALYEDLDEGADSLRHVDGTSLILPSISLDSPLQRAVCWAHLRQGIYVSCSKRKPMQKLERIPLEPGFEPVGDDVWVHRTLSICARAVQWAFGEDSTASTWRELNSLITQWESKRPGSFIPIFRCDRSPGEGCYFPQICYVTDNHVSGNQFLLLAKLLLVTHDPTLPRIGPRMKTALENMQEEARRIVWDLCGMALWNDYVPAGFIAALALRMCGSLFEDETDRYHLLEVLRITEERSGWPRAVAERALREEWGWEV